ncbi:MAG: hypothetical protein ACUVV5_07445 [Candidatus Aminicenantales bacterium]
MKPHRAFDTVGEKERGLGEKAGQSLSGEDFSSEGREERKLNRSEFPRWGNERASESRFRAWPGVDQDRNRRVMLAAVLRRLTV